MDVAAPKAIAEGTLAETPLAHVLLSIERRSLSGTLAIWPDDQVRGQDRVLFESGRLTAARLLEPATALDRGLLPLFTRERAPYAFYEENLLGSAPGILVGPASVPALLAASLRGPTREDVVDRVLAGFGQSALRMLPGAALERFGLLAKEAAVVEMIRAAPAPAAELVASYGDPRVARRVLYLLAITRCLETFDGARQSSPSMPAAPRQSSPSMPAAPRQSTPAARPEPQGSAPISTRPSAPAAPMAATASTPAPPRAHVEPAAPELPPPPPDDLSAELRARWEAIASLVQAMDEYNYFELLELGEGATNAQVSEAYAARVKQVHPDRLAPELRTLAPYCQRVFQQATDAKNTLVDPDKRMAHLKAIKSGGGTPAHDRKLGAIVEAAMEFQKVDVLVRCRQLDEALAIVEHVLAVSPDEADYIARKAWLLMQLHTEATGPKADEALRLTEEALALHPRHEQAHFTRASLLKRRGDAVGALEHFRQASRANPKNIEAAREVRLAEMRERNPSPVPEGGPGFFKKLFKKD